MTVSQAIGILKNLGHSDAAAAVTDLVLDFASLSTRIKKMEEELKKYEDAWACLPKTFPPDE